MLSTTYSISDVKTRLEQGYADFSLASEEAFTNAVIIALDDAQLMDMWPIMGSGSYTVTQAKDKIDLSEKETYLYWAEIYYACSKFLERRSSATGATSSNASSEKLEVEGYRYESATEAASGTSVNMSTAIRDYYDKAVGYMCLAGHNPHNLQRGGNMFSDGDSEFVYGDIV